MGKTSIEWCDRTWSPIRYRVRQDAAEIARAKGYGSLVQIAQKMAGHVGQHCEHVSPGCANCYSGTMQARCLPVNGTGLPFDRRSRDLVEPFLDEKELLEPLKWRTKQRVFVENQSDLFGEWVQDDMIDLVFAVMSQSPSNTYQILTKRAERMQRYIGNEVREDRIDGTSGYFGWCHTNIEGRWPLPNVWLGVSVEDQQRKPRIDDLRATPAAIRFLSLEPLLEDLGSLDLTGIDWVIVGGESGRGARPMHPAWARSIRDQCQVAGVPFFFKQYGEWFPGWFTGKERGIRIDPAGRELTELPGLWSESDSLLWNVGKKAAGRLLDGRYWSEFPKEEAR